MFNFFKSILNYFLPKPIELIHFQCDGCMATDWIEIDRGIITDYYSRFLYGGFQPTDMVEVTRKDGSTFECFAVDCLEGQEYMQKNTKNPDECLVGKIVYLR